MQAIEAMRTRIPSTLEHHLSFLLERVHTNVDKGSTFRILRGSCDML